MSEEIQAPTHGCARSTFVDEMRAHFNEPILLSDRLARLVAFGEDDHDYYLVCVYMGGERVWHTAVGGYTYLNRLKGQGYVLSTSGEEWDDLFRLDQMLSLNGAPKAEAFHELKHPNSTDD
jgi:hypothetical protein